MIAQSLSMRTIDERIRVVNNICDETGVCPRDLDVLTITQWLATRPNPVTRWSYYTCIKAFFRWLSLTGRISSNPLDFIPAPKRPKYYPRPLSPIHLRTVLSGKLRRKTRVMIMLAAYAGLRVHEIAKIHGGRDYDRITNQLTVLGKGRQLALIPIHRALVPLLDQMPDNTWWFPSPDNSGPIKPASVSATIKRAFAKHGITMTAHQLRHTYGTELLAAGVDLRVVQELMRHESIQSTSLYTQVPDSQLELSINQLPDPPQSDE